MLNNGVGVKVAGPVVPVAVIGQDIDRSLIRSLTPRDGKFAGDRVLLEINGKRQYSCQPHPLIAELSWEVIGNDAESLTLKHPSCPRELRLGWNELLKGPSSEPAVFLTQYTYLSKLPLYVLLQFVAYSAPSDTVLAALPPEWDMEIWDEILQDPMVKRATLEKLSKDLMGLSKGWSWKSVCRFALRSGVKPKTIEAFRICDWFKINSLSDDVIKMILQELRWMRSYRQQSESVQVKLDEIEEDGTDTDNPREQTPKLER